MGMKRICLVVADATRARIYTHEYAVEPGGSRDQIVEIVDLVDPARRQTEQEMFCDRTGSSHSGGRGYSFDDHRRNHLDHLDAAFAKHIASEADRITREHGIHELVLVANPRMLGLLRHPFEPLARTVTITELERDYTKLTTPELRDRLAELDLLPPRPRLAFANR
jgi:protein required for attachment to host cells